VIPSEHFNTVTYAGSSGSQSITNVGFTPDLLWFKNRSGAYGHKLQDIVRGVTKTLSANDIGAEETHTAVASFDSGGFSLTGSDNSYNNSSHTYVAWNWKANGTGVSNTSGSITSTVSANVDAGFSIVSYTGTGANATIGHGLSVAPEMTFFFERTTTSNKYVWHKILLAGGEIYLNTTGPGYPAYSSNLTPTLPTNSIYYLGPGNDQNQSGSDFISYHFHSVDGYSKVGSYTGNGSADGTFVYTGFDVMWLLIKKSSGAGDWVMLDSERTTDYEMYASGSNAESHNGDRSDFTSNGFKLRSTSALGNTSGATYIYLAFAKTPFKYSNAVGD
jgi:hypothetical protein